MAIDLSALLKELQQSIALFDLLERQNESNNSFPSYSIFSLPNIKIKIYQEKKHQQPHIHLDIGKERHVASFSIDPPSKIKGEIAKKYEIIVSKWIEKNKNILLRIWEEAQGGGKLAELVVELND